MLRSSCLSSFKKPFCSEIGDFFQRRRVSRRSPNKRSRHKKSDAWESDLRMAEWFVFQKWAAERMNANDDARQSILWWRIRLVAQIVNKTKGIRMSRSRTNLREPWKTEQTSTRCTRQQGNSGGRCLLFLMRKDLVVGNEWGESDELWLLRKKKIGWLV